MARKRNGGWQGDVRINGTRYRRLFATQEQAEAWETRVRQGGPDVVSQSTHLKGFIEEQFDYLWGDQKSSETTRMNLDVVCRYLGPTLEIAFVSTAAIAQMVGRMRKDGKTNATINRKLAALSKLLGHAEDLGVIERKPKIAYLEEGASRHRVLSSDEEAKLFGWFEQASLMATYHHYRFALYTGARMGEISKVEWRDIHWENGEPVSVTFRDTKTGSHRAVPLLNPARAAVIWGHQQGHRKPFPTSRSRLRADWANARDWMGMRKDPCFVPHMLRHTCLTRMVQKGVDLARIQRWAGHTSYPTTLRYAQLVPKDLDQVLLMMEDKG